MDGHSQNAKVLEDTSPVVPLHDMHSEVVLHFKHFSLQAYKKLIIILFKLSNKKL